MTPKQHPAARVDVGCDGARDDVLSQNCDTSSGLGSVPAHRITSGSLKPSSTPVECAALSS